MRIFIRQHAETPSVHREECRKLGRVGAVRLAAVADPASRGQMTGPGYVGWVQHVGTKALLALSLTLAAGCDLLPSDGPNANNVIANSSGALKSDAASTAVTRYVLVSVNGRIAERAAQYC